MNFRISLIFVAAALKFWRQLSAAPAPVLDQSLNVRTTLNFRMRGATLCYRPSKDLGREPHMNFLKIVEKPEVVEIKDIRGLEEKFQLNVNGFTYVKDKVKGLENCATDEEYDTLLMPAAENLVREMTQAKAVFAFNYRIRDKIPGWKGEGAHRTPVPSVHSDFSAPGAEEAVKRVILKNPDNEEVKKLETLAKDPNNKLVVIHLWRPLEVVKRNPITMCDWKTVDAKNDHHACRPGGPDGNECMQWHFNPQNKWYYLSEQKPDEVTMFVQYDSDVQGHMTLPHASFQESDEKDLPTRRSMEIRVMAVLSKNQDMSKKVEKEVI